MKKATVEETTSELWYETYNGKGKLKFKNNMEYKGNLHYGMINNEDPESPCTLIFPSGTKYIGTMINNEITGQGKYIFKIRNSNIDKNFNHKIKNINLKFSKLNVKLNKVIGNYSRRKTDLIPNNPKNKKRK